MAQLERERERRAQTQAENSEKLQGSIFVSLFQFKVYRTNCELGVDRLSAPILSILPIIDIGHFKNRFADNNFLLFLFI